MLNHWGHFGGSPPPPREHFEYPNGSPILNAKYARKKYGKSAQSGRRIIPIESSRETQMVEQEIARSIAQHFMQRRPRQRRRRAARRRASRSTRNTNFPSRDSMYCARARCPPPSRCGCGGSWSPTAISRVIVLHSAGALSRASVACHVPAAGDATSANQKYGGPPCRSRDLAATLPSGAISESSPSSGFSAAKTTRKGAPCHGAIGEGRTASSAASSQLPDEPWARTSTPEKRKTKHAPAISNDAVAAAANGRARNNGVPFLERFPRPRPQPGPDRRIPNWRGSVSKAAYVRDGSKATTAAWPSHARASGGGAVFGGAKPRYSVASSPRSSRQKEKAPANDRSQMTTFAMFYLRAFETFVKVLLRLVPTV